MEIAIVRRLLRMYSFGTCRVSDDLTLEPASLLRAISLFSVLPILQYLGSRADGALLLPSPGRGLLQHQGQWAVFAATPVFVLINALAFRHLAVILRDLQKLAEGPIPSSVKTEMLRCREAFRLQTRERAVLYLFVILGTMVAITNIYQSTDTMRFYGNDIFDAVRHTWGFRFTKLSNVILYSVVYPVVLFQMLLLSSSLRSIVKLMMSTGTLRVDFLDEDGCGGLGAIGQANLYTMANWALVFGIIYADFETQKQTALTLALSLFVSALVFVAQSVYGVLYLSTYLSARRQANLLAINRAISGLYFRPLDYARIAPLLTLRQIVEAMNPMPYSKQARLLVDAFRIVPPILAVARLLK